MTQSLPGGRRRSNVAMATAIERGQMEAPKPTLVVENRPAAPLAYVPPPKVIEVEREKPKPKGGRPRLPGDPAYRRAKPCPHMVIDDFLPDDLAQEAFMAFPSASDPVWREHGREFTGTDKARKLEMAKREAMPEPLQRVVDLVHGDAAMAKFRALTGFDDLFADPALYGGGLNLVEPGGFLKPHADFNWNDQIKAFRTINVLIYLNEGWKPADGGELELWHEGKVAKRIEPKFNRCLVFTTTQDAVHGYQPVKATRMSIGFYLYRKQPAKGIAPEPHKTLWAE